MAKKNQSKPDPSKPTVHTDLSDLDIRVNEMGEIVRDFDIEKVNAFLDKNVKDKKLTKDEEDEQ